MVNYRLEKAEQLVNCNIPAGETTKWQQEYTNISLFYNNDFLREGNQKTSLLLKSNTVKQGRREKALLSANINISVISAINKQN